MHVVRHGYGGLTGQLRPGKSIPDIPSTAALPNTHRPIRPMSGISYRAVIMQLRSGTESSLTGDGFESTTARKPAISDASRHDCGADSLNRSHR